MTELQFPVLRGYIEIERTGPLEDVAVAVSRALGSVLLSQDESGHFEEYPAFVGDAVGLQFALLGDPLPEDDIRDDRDVGYTLQITSIVPQPTVSDVIQVDVTPVFVELLSSRGIICRPLS